MCIFLPSSEFSVVLDISDSDYNISLPIRRFSHEGFLISKHSSILHVLLNSHHIYQDSMHYHFYENPNHLVLYTHTNVYYGSIFALNYIHFHLIHIYNCKIHAELKILFHLLPTLNQIPSNLYFLLLEHKLEHRDRQYCYSSLQTY